MDENNDKANRNHITARVDINLKRDGLQYASDAARTASWVWAKAIELGLPELKKLYPPAVKNPKKRAA